MQLAIALAIYTGTILAIVWYVSIQVRGRKAARQRSVAGEPRNRQIALRIVLLLVFLAVAFAGWRLSQLHW